MFNGVETEMQTQAGHNVHEDFGGFQEGGTVLMLYGPLIEQYDFEASVKDDTGLGLWVVIVLQGTDGITTRIICGYNPCYNKKKDSWTTY